MPRAPVLGAYLYCGQTTNGPADGEVYSGQFNGADLTGRAVWVVPCLGRLRGRGPTSTAA